MIIHCCVFLIGLQSVYNYLEKFPLERGQCCCDTVINLFLLKNSIILSFFNSIIPFIFIIRTKKYYSLYWLGFVYFIGPYLLLLTGIIIDNNFNLSYSLKKASYITIDILIDLYFFSIGAGILFFLILGVIFLWNKLKNKLH